MENEDNAIIVQKKGISLNINLGIWYRIGKDIVFFRSGTISIWMWENVKPYAKSGLKTKINGSVRKEGEVW